MSEYTASDLQGLRRDWEAVGSHISAAMQEVATDLGGEELAERVALVAASDSSLPNPDALKLLDELYPGAAERTMRRSEEIQAETHGRELAAVRKPSLRKYGGTILEGFASFNIWGARPKRNH